MLSQKARYAIRAVLYLAIHSEDNRPLTIEALAKELELPHAFLAKVMKELVDKGFVHSIKGPHGGFYLSEAQQRKTLKQLITVLDGPHLFQGCIVGLPECDETQPCPLHSSVALFRKSLELQLSMQTIQVIAQLMKHTSMRV